MRFESGSGIAAVVISLVLTGVPFTSLPLRAGEKLDSEIDRINRLTGAEPMQGALKALLDNPAHAKKVLAAALPLTKQEDKLTYNGAMVLALAAADQKDLKTAEAFFRICMQQAAKLQSARKLLQSYGALIDLYYDNKQYDDSARVCRELLELKTDDGKPRIVLKAVTTRFGETEFDEEEGGFDTAKRLRPFMHKQLIQAITKQGKYEQALKLVEVLIKTQDDWRERQLKGWVLREAGKYAEAAQVYEDVLKLVQKDKDLETDERELYTERYSALLSNIYVDAKQIDKAAKKLQELLSRKPDDPGYHNDLGYIWADNDQNLDEAEKLIRRALELDEKRRKALKVPPEEDHANGAYLDSLGWVLYKKKQYKEAVEVLQKAVEDKASQHIEIYDHLGDAYLALGNREKAVEAWRKGLEHVGEGRREAERKASVERKIEMYKK